MQSYAKRYVTIAGCQLNQWQLQFNHNLKNIIQSIEMAKAKGASYRVGPELEISGYTCEDHFFESDTVMHSWQSLGQILSSPTLTKDIICDIGMPVTYQHALYNCRVFCLNGKIIFIRPKVALAEGNNYREGRWFTAWQKN
jgi:NAD+ synthase (glutamine-hydrolysing)